MNPNSVITKAMNFAAQKHADQRRKGAKQEPYFNHVAEVAWLLAEHTGGQDAELIAAGLLHDTIEDTATTHAELVREFGQNIADIVMEVSDDKSLPKQERKRLQVEHAPHKSDKARLVKIADKTANLRAILESPPDGWGEERKREYFIWAKAVVDGCRGLNQGLEDGFDTLYKRGMSAFTPKI
ncbi:MAG: HD domain-containing protein [Alphaproteobacteria bacterium]|nr:HD domain-containing protein [Alphaproteobacteria bacterium]